MTQRLTDMSIDRISLVDKGANARVIALLKRNEEAAMTDQAEAPFTPGWLRKAADWLSAKLDPTAIAKTATFAEVVAGQELQDALYDSWYTLEDVLWGAIYAYDENGKPLPTEAKTALVGQDLDEFKTYLLAQMAGASVAKSDQGSPDQRRLGAMVRKVGKKISGDRLGRLNTAAEALNSVLAEVAEVVQAADEADEAEETTVEKNELVAAMTEVLEPITKRLDAIEASTKKPVAKADPDPADAGDVEAEDGDVTNAAIAKAIMSLADRVEKLEGSGSVRKSLVGQDGAAAGSEPVKKSVFAGILD